MSAPVAADRYSYKEASFEAELLARCLVTGFYSGFGGKADISAITPPKADCARAFLPCHLRHDAPLDTEFDLSTLPRDQQHQVSHCLYQHVEEAEFLAFQQITRRLSEPSEFKPRTTIRGWLTGARDRYQKCATRFERRDINLPNCNLKAVIEYAADYDTVLEVRAEIQKIEEGQ